MKEEKKLFIVRLTILTVVMIVVWVVLDILMAIKKEPETEIPKEIFQEFDSTLDINALEEIKQKNYFEGEAPGVFQAPAAAPTTAPSPSPLPSPTPSATQSPGGTQ